jgi:hypothetical protein
MTRQDRWLARRLPDDFLCRAGGPKKRIRSTVARIWWDHDRSDLECLADILVPVLSDLMKPGAEVTDEHRNRSETLVSRWLNSSATRVTQCP